MDLCHAGFGKTILMKKIKSEHCKMWSHMKWRLGQNPQSGHEWGEGAMSMTGREKRGRGTARSTVQNQRLWVLAFKKLQLLGSRGSKIEEAISDHDTAGLREKRRKS